jgi:hypothetical protein
MDKLASARTIITLAFPKSQETADIPARAKKVEQIRLRQKIWQKLREKPQAEAAVAAASQGSKLGLEQVVNYLQEAMERDAQFACAIQTLVRSI